MKSFTHFCLLFLGVTTALVSYHFLSYKTPDFRTQYSEYLKHHPFNNRERETGKGEKEKADRPDLAWEQDYLRTMDPALGRPAPERLTQTIQQLNTHSGMFFAPGSLTTPWIERGPMNVGGRTRALAWDPNDPNGTKVWAGGVTGGLWYNNDITNGNSNWNAVNDFWDNISITCLAFDPNNTQIMYVGTGEGWGGSGTPTRGAGIWKSTNGGSSWTQLASTTGFYYVNDIAVRNESGVSVVYAAVDGNFYQGQFHGSAAAGLQRSVNGGTSWTQVLPNVPSMSVNFVASDIEIGANNRIWIGTRRSPYSATDRGGGRILHSDNGTSWTISNTTTVTNGYGRVEVACAPSNPLVVYALIENNNVISAMKTTVDGGTNWTPITPPVDADTGIPTNDFSRGQAWYDLILAVDPSNASKVIVGAIDLFRSTNSGGSWSQISKWSNNNNLNNLTCSYVHADQHAIVYKPGSSSTLLVGNDGGVFYTNFIDSAATRNVFSERNRNYNVTQFYACAQHPGNNAHYYLAGSQDNGTQRFTQSGMNVTTEATGGDGAYCFIDQTTPSYQVTSYVFNNYYRSSNGGSSFTSTLIADNGTGKFINPADYDDNLHILYSARNSTSIYRVRNITTTPSAAETVTLSGVSDNVSHLRVSPYTTASTTLFLGTDAGFIYKVSNANGSSSIAYLDSNNLLPTGTISCIEVGANENELLVTFYNYGINSVWYTANGGTSWVNKEGNLPDMPVRWALFNPNNRNEVILATELGVWSTTGFNLTTPSWSSSSSGLANVRVDMLQIRSSDLQVVAATHGRGLFTCNGFALAAAPDAGFKADKKYVCLNETVSLTDTSLNYPSSRTWSITPATFNFMGGTNASSANPKIQFLTSGVYSVTLNVSNASGTDSMVQNSLITAGGLTLPFNENWESTGTSNRWTIENPDFYTTWAIRSVAGNGSSTKAMYVDNYNYDEAKNKSERDGLISPPISLVNMSSATMTFKYAYRGYSLAIQDSLAVFVSSDCGSGWTRVGTYRETNSASPFVFFTNNMTTSAFTPSTSADWCGNTNFGTCKTIDLTPFSGQTIRIKFENISNFGNNLYIDDIQITGIASQLTPLTFFKANTTNVCSGKSVSFIDSTTGAPTSWQWSFTPASVTFLGNTNANSQHPVVAFQAGGSYHVKLRTSNANGSDSLTRSNYISVTSSVTPSIQITASDTNICSGDSVHFSLLHNNGGTAPRFRWKVNQTLVDTQPTFSTRLLNNNDTVTCTLISNAVCATDTLVVSKKVSMVVHNKPPVTLSFVNREFCHTDTTILLSGGNPSGGVFSGTGVSSNSFKPMVSGTGTFHLTYTVTDGFGCINSAKDSMIVHALPSVTFVLPNDNLCHSDTTLNLTGGLPTGGIYSGTGITNNQFKPMVSGPGAFAISYTVTSNKGCKNTGKDSLFVHALPSVSLALNTKVVCQSDTTFTLTGGSPSGGVFSGPGVVSNQFKTAVSGSGLFNINYTVTNVNGCKNMASDTIRVHPLPAVTFTLLADNFCLGDTTISLEGGAPAGGIYSGPGVSANQFKPLVSGTGSFALTYRITDTKGCSNAAKDSIHVNPLPNVSFNLAKDAFCLTDTVIVLNGGFPAGGIYSGTGVGSGQFNPLNSGAGKFALTYSFTSVKGCINKAVDSIRVHPLPVVSFALPFTQLCSVDSLVNMSGGIPSGGIYTGPGIAGNQLNPKNAGTGFRVIQYRFSDINGCSDQARDSLQIHALPVKPSITRSGDTLICSTTENTYQWFLNGNVLPGANARNFVPQQNGIYRVHTTNLSGCTSSSDTFSFVFSSVSFVQSDNLMTAIYPNPTHGRFHIQTNLKQAATLRVVIQDMTGRKLVDQVYDVEAGKQQTGIVLDGVAAGSYLITVYGKAEMAQKTLIIE